VLRGEATLDADAPIDRVWALVSDVEKIGQCVPGVESITVRDASRAEWTVSFKVGPLTQRVLVETEITERVEPTRIGFQGRADNLELSGTVRLDAHGPRTSILYTLSLEPKGKLARILESYLRGKIDQQTQHFLANLREALRSESAPA
jgi:carbon monoxide dehydrogenase subunit G